MRTDRISSLRALAVLAGAAFAVGGCTIDSTESKPAEEPYVLPDAGVTPWTPPGPEKQDRKLVILHTNDEHSQLLGYGPQSLYPWVSKPDGTLAATDLPWLLGRLAADHQTVGGMVRRQFLINKIRKDNPDSVLTISAGDVMMGTIMHAATPTASPDYLAMAVVGYDFATLGNHEFDWGNATLASAIHSVQNTVFGGSVPLIASNIHFEDVNPTTAPDAAAVKALFGEGNSGAAIMPWATKTLANGLKVGFVGGLGYEAASVAPLKTPISFSTPRNGIACTQKSDCVTASAGDACIRSKCVNTRDATAHVAAMVADIQPYVDLLRNQEKVDVVVLISHSGKVEDEAMAALFKGVDIIIGGHSHDEIAEPEEKDRADGSGKTIVVQAGDYGRKLGQVTLKVAKDGAVSLVKEESKLIPIDHTVDAQIMADSDLTKTPPVVGAGLTTAMKLTAGVIGPVIGGLNQKLAPAIGIPDILAPIIHSDHDIIGELPSVDTNLNQLTTDAVRGVVAMGACMNPANGPIVAVQANGVMRQSLHFTPANGSTPGDASFADLFSVVPLGASPFATGPAVMPGYPLVRFVLTPAQIYAGADVGVTTGLVSGDFFLSYAGMRIEYDKALPPFNPATFNPMSADPNGRVTKIEIQDQVGNWVKLYEYDAAKAWALRWENISPSTGKLQIVTNLYIASFLDTFGMKPKADDGVTDLPLQNSVLCVDMAQKAAGGADCAHGKPVFVPCYSTAGATANPPRWMAPELKEWSALVTYVTNMPNQTIPTPAYRGETPQDPRVKEKPAE